MYSVRSWLTSSMTCPRVPDGQPQLLVLDQSERFGKTVLARIAIPGFDIANLPECISQPQGRPSVPASQEGEPRFNLDAHSPSPEIATECHVHGIKCLPDHAPIG